MKRLLASLIFATGLSAALASDIKASLEDILLLAQRGVSDETILVFLQTREIGFTPGSEEIDKLLNAGVSEKVIRYLLTKTADAKKPPEYPATPVYVAAYPPYYYGSSISIGFSVFPHVWFRHHYVALHHGGHPTHLAAHPGQHHAERHVSHGVVHHDRRDRHGAGHRAVAGHGLVNHRSATVAHPRNEHARPGHSGLATAGRKHGVRRHVAARSVSHGGNPAGHQQARHRGVSAKHRAGGHSGSVRVGHRSRGHGGLSAGRHGGRGGGHGGGRSGGHGGGHGGGH